MAIELKNPHSVLAAIQTRPRDVFDIQVATDAPSPAWTEVLDLAQANAIRILRGGRPAARDRRSDKEGRETGMSANVRERADVPLEQLFADAATRANGSGLWLALDNLQDPHNVGAIIRTAAFFGVQGIVVTKDRSAPLNGTVYDVAAGGVEHVPFTLVPNLARAVSVAKESRLWVLGTSEHATEDVSQVDRERPWLLIVGNEEKGMRRLTAEHCDAVCRITPRGEVTSLNVSVATGILIATLSSGPPLPDGARGESQLRFKSTPFNSIACVPDGSTTSITSLAGPLGSDNVPTGNTPQRRLT
jgi:23S rRNA (guanosine2251-2'-O)-methyltransferase